MTPIKTSALDCKTLKVGFQFFFQSICVIGGLTCAPINTLCRVWVSSSTSAHLQPNLSRWNRCVKRAVCRMMAQGDIDDLCEVCECQPIPPSSVCVPMTGEEWIHFS